MMWKMKKVDVVLIVFYLVLTAIMTFAAVAWKAGANYDQKKLEIQIEGKLVKELVLPVNRVTTLPFHTKLGYNLVKIDGDQVTIIDADCRDKVCVHSGSIHEAGELLVCLPHKFIVEIKGVKSEHGTVDSVTH